LSAVLTTVGHLAGGFDAWQKWKEIDTVNRISAEQFAKSENWRK
jgi:hypothetical protein